METGYPSTRAVNSGSGNRALLSDYRTFGLSIQNHCIVLITENNLINTKSTKHTTVKLVLLFCVAAVSLTWQSYRFELLVFFVCKIAFVASSTRSFLCDVWCRKLEEVTKLCDDKNEEFKQLEHQDTRIREDLKYAHNQAKKLEKSLAQEQKKVVLSDFCVSKNERDRGFIYLFVIKKDERI